HTYAGATIVSAGELDLNKAAGTTAVPGALTVNAGTVKLLASNQIADGFSVTVGSVSAAGTLDLGTNNVSDTIGSLTLTGSTVTTGTGTLTVSGDLVTNAASTTSTVSG